MPMVVFKRGSKGPTVREIQQRLNMLAGYAMSPMGNGSSQYPPLDDDGKYGKKTSDRVKEFQMWNPPLKVDGKVGPNTWGKLTGKFWSPEVAKAAQEAAPPAAASAERSTQPVKYVYLLDAANHTTGVLPRRSGHAWEQCEYHLVQPNCTWDIASDLETLLEGEGKTVEQMILLAHSAGAGHLSYGGNSPHFGGSSVSLFRTIKPHFAPGAVIWIFGCAFAAARKNVIGPDFDTVQLEELLHTEGGGISAMKDIARFTGCRVRAGFTSQTLNLDTFTDLWCEVAPNGKVDYYLSGRAMTIEHLADYMLKGALMSSILMPFAYGLWGWEKFS